MEPINIEQKPEINFSIPHVSEEEINDILKFGNDVPIFKIDDPFFYRQAFVHKSIPEDVKKCEYKCQSYMETSNERLEFLGDGMFNTAITYYLYEHYKNVEEGELSKMRARIIRGTNMSHVADRMNFRKHILVSNSVLNSKKNDRFLEDVFEAFCGAIFLDKGGDTMEGRERGFGFVYEFAINVLRYHVPESVILKNTNYKDILIHFTKVFDISDFELVQRKVEKEFFVYVRMEGNIYEETSALKLKTAEQRASKIVIEKLGITEELINKQRQFKKSLSPKKYMNQS